MGAERLWPVWVLLWGSVWLYLGWRSPGYRPLFQASSISTAACLWLGTPTAIPSPSKHKWKSFQVLVFKPKGREAKSLGLQKRCVQERGVHVAEATLPVEVRGLQQQVFLSQGSLSAEWAAMATQSNDCHLRTYIYGDIRILRGFSPLSGSLCPWYFLRTVWGLQWLALGLTKHFSLERSKLQRGPHSWMGVRPGGEAEWSLRARACGLRPGCPFREEKT